MKVIDAFLYFNELDILKARIEYLSDVVDQFVIVESAYSFTGQPKQISLPETIQRDLFFSPYSDKIFILTNHHYIDQSAITDGVHQLAQYPVCVEELLKANEIRENTNSWLNDCYQRELLYSALVHIVDEDDIIIVSDIDEIPAVQFYLSDPQTDLVFAKMNEYRYSLQFRAAELWQGSVKFKRSLLRDFSVNTLRFFQKRGLTGLSISFEVSGWHFTSFGSISSIQQKMHSWGHQELNTKLNRLLLRFRISRGFDIFGRNHVLYLDQEQCFPDSIKTHLGQFSNYDFVSPSVVDFCLNRLANLSGKLLRVLSK